jgi:hypothetical protein
MLIGLTGKARSGKDKAGSILFLNHGFIRVAIADPLKTAAAVMYCLDPAEFHDDALKDQVEPRWGITRRSMIQNLGEMVKQNLDPEFWMKNWFLRYALVGDSNHVVVTDVRFDYEAERIIQLGGVIVDMQRLDSGLAGQDAQHVSEQGLNPSLITHTINNNGSISDLSRSLEALLAGLPE